VFLKLSVFPNIQGVFGKWPPFILGN
jgi:hypothetical protein